jgi:hypothetical protein
MYDPTLQTRFARSAFDAMFGYVQASQAASSAIMGNTLEFWGNAAKSMSGQPPRSSQTALSLWPMPQQNPAQMMMQPLEMWMSFTPFGRSPLAVQMAYAMMSFGVPRDVAMPAAKANTAMLDAAETATQQFDDAFASYRSDGGHASAQIRYLRIAMSMALLPMSFAAFWPMLTNARGPGF